MKTYFKKYILAAVLFTVTLFGITDSANAWYGPRYRGAYWGGYGCYRPYYRPYRPYYYRPYYYPYYYQTVYWNYWYY